MNTQQAKQLSLPDIMARLGYQPVEVKKGGTQLWYLSPFRKESKPSFVTSHLSGKWIWKDFGDIGGTVIDFVMRHEGFSKIGDALSFLKRYNGSVPQKSSALFPFKQQARAESKTHERELEFIKAAPISNPVILKYLTENRCLSESVSLKYLQEITYRNKTNGKEFFAFGMQNRSGGYEIRAATDEYPFKSALICRDITIIAGNDLATQTLSVFEGMTDFLSLLTLNKVGALDDDVLVMHSLSSFERVTAYIIENQYQQINLYLDNDQPGLEITHRFIQILGKIIFCKSEIYQLYKDLNEYLKKKSHIS